jgi:23S rRNA (adenine2030-N6)-methyltransferase
MLSYQHGYHAGCFADVIKHSILTQLLRYMIQKDKPLFYLETHAGRGMYDLQDAYAMKTLEFQDGIGRLWHERASLPPVFSPYIHACEAVNATDRLHFYPGSPSFAIQQLRAEDRLFFCEFHPKEFNALKQLPKQNKRVFYSQDDGMKSLLALLPPPERRGLIFIDPSYEVKTEYREVVRAIESAYRRFSTGVFCLWYPIVDKKQRDQLIRGLDNIKAPSLQIEFDLNQKDKRGMQGTGLWVLNPPHVLGDNARVVLDTLKQIFNPGWSSYQLN